MFCILIFTGSAAHIDGALVYCGGYNIHDASVSPLKTCHFLKHPPPGWVKTFPLLQVMIVGDNEHLASKNSTKSKGGMKGVIRFYISWGVILMIGYATEPSSICLFKKNLKTI